MVQKNPIQKTLVQRALVLEGGGLRGQFTAGVLDAFLEAGIEFPYIVGVSAGASMACSYISGQFGRNQEIIERFRNDRRYLSWWNFFTQGSLFGMDFIFREIPRRLVPFDYAAFEAHPAHFETVCTDCGSGEALYYDKSHDAMTVLKASASLPYLSPMVKYQGRKLLDGAIVDAIPLERAESQGYGKQVVVLTRPAGYRKTPETPSAARWVYRRYPALLEALDRRVERYNSSLAHVEAQEAAGQALVIRPSGRLEISRTEKSVAKLRELYEEGLEAGRLAASSLKTS